MNLDLDFDLDLDLDLDLDFDRHPTLALEPDPSGLFTHKSGFSTPSLRATALKTNR